MTLAGTDGCDGLMPVPRLCFFYLITLEILLYSIWWCVKSSEVYFMIIYCYDINSLSCLTSFLHALPHTGLILMNIFLQAQCFYGYSEQGRYPFFYFNFFPLASSGYLLLRLFLQVLLSLHLKLNEIQLYKQLLISP